MRDAQLVMPKAVSAAMAAWITARRICVQVIFLDSWLDSFMEISVFCQFKMRMEQKEVTELADGHGGVKEESVSPVFHNHIMLSLWSGTSRSAIFVCRFAGGGWNAGGVSVVSGNADGRRIARQVYRSLSGLQCLHYFGGCLARGNQLEFGILAQVVETDARSHSTFTSVMFSTVNSAIEWAPRLRILFENTPDRPSVSAVRSTTARAGSPRQE